ncbi:transposase [Umezawaea endophytica]|uniref:Transposase n=1 Tax=Umezawaea endophytica TaxID=1654476 RepID=A0A9X2VL67_9PSEU|nr:transposase [Umezawaea endophytica]MCS7478557.1 transposase [Umezawaea endophytica]
MDSTIMHTRQHAAGARKGGCGSDSEALAVVGEGLDQSCGGLSTKIHPVVDGRGLPMWVLLDPGQAGDNPQLLPLLDGTRVRRDGPGRPRSRPDAVIANRAYSHPSTRRTLRRCGVVFVSGSGHGPEMAPGSRFLAAGFDDNKEVLSAWRIRVRPWVGTAVTRPGCGSGSPPSVLTCAIGLAGMGC